MYYQLGSKHKDVKAIQIALELEPTGFFDVMTQAAVKNFQKKNDLLPSGIVDPETMELLIKPEISTDLSESVVSLGTDLCIEQYLLPEKEYVTTEGIISKRDYIFLHHTAGNNDPYQTIRNWATDKRGRIGTHFVIGGESRGHNADYDGVVVQAIPDDYWAYHLGNVNHYMHSHSYSIEICNYGWLKKEGNDFFNAYGGRMPSDQVIKLNRPFRGYEYYHRYTDNQIYMVSKLVPYLAEEAEIDIKKGLQFWINKLGVEHAFEYFTDAVAGKVRGLLSHTNVRTDKTDIYPHPDIVDVIISF